MTASFEEWNLINNLRKHRKFVSKMRIKDVVKRILPMKAINELKAKRMRAKGIPLVTPKIDDYDIEMDDREQLNWAIDLLNKAKEESDFVVACIHCGGQFNETPGRHSIQIYDLLEEHADAIIGNHPHVIQRMEINNKKVRVYSLGSVNMSLSSDYISKEFSPEYSLVVHLHIKSTHETKNVELEKVTYDLLCGEEDETGYIYVSRVYTNPREYVLDVNPVREIFHIKCREV